MGTDGLLQHFGHLELTLQRLEVRRDRTQLDKLLHESFDDFDRPGRRYDKAGILEHSPQETGLIVREPARPISYCR